MSTELYKKYRPRGLTKMVGNEWAVAALQQMITQKRVPHTILFSGPSGCGKTTLARILGKELGCSAFDFREMNCASHNGIETIREIERTLHQSTLGGSCRVWLLDECHMLTAQAQNAALTMLETTPNHVYFMLCTTDPQKLIKTVRSRCCDIVVKPLTDAQLVSLLTRVAKREKMQVTAEVNEAIIEVSLGSARNALVHLDTVRNLPESQRLAAISAEADKEEGIALCRAILKGESWRRVGAILKGLTTDPETLRWSVLMYAKAVLLNSGQPRAYRVLCAFEDPFYESKQAGLVRACYEAVVAGED